jgi:hypothetical protein
MRLAAKLAVCAVALVAAFAAVIASTTPTKCQAGADAAGCLALIGGPTGQALAALAKNDAAFLGSLKKGAESAKLYEEYKCSAHTGNYAFMALSGMLTGLVAKGKATKPPEEPYLPDTFKEAKEKIDGLIAGLVAAILTEAGGPLSDVANGILAGLPSEIAEKVKEVLAAVTADAKDKAKKELTQLIQDQLAVLGENPFIKMLLSFLDCGLVVATSGVDEQISATLEDTKGCWNFLNTCVGSLGDCLAGVAALGEAIAKGIANLPGAVVGAIVDGFNGVIDGIGDTGKAIGKTIEDIHCNYFGKCLVGGVQQEICIVNVGCAMGESMNQCKSNVIATAAAYPKPGFSTLCTFNAFCPPTAIGATLDPAIGPVCTCPLGQAWQNGACAACPTHVLSSTNISPDNTCWSQTYNDYAPSLDRLKCELKGTLGTPGCCATGMKLIAGLGLSPSACGPICGPKNALFNPGTKQCSVCQPGSFGKVASTNSNSHGTVLIGECEKCKPWETSALGSVGAESCTLKCTAEGSMFNPKTEACDVCGLNSYGDLQKASFATGDVKIGECKLCPKGAKSDKASIGLNSCGCPADTQLKNGECVSCGAGTYSKGGSVTLLAKSLNPECKKLVCPSKNGKPQFVNDNLQCEACPAWAVKSDGRQCIGPSSANTLSLVGTCSKRGSNWQDNPDWKVITDATGKPVGYGGPGEQCVCKFGYKVQDGKCVRPEPVASCASRGAGFIANPNNPRQCICKSGYQRVGNSCIETNIALPRGTKPQVEKTSATAARNCPPGTRPSPSGKNCLPDLDGGGGFSLGSRPGGTGGPGGATASPGGGCRKC